MNNNSTYITIISEHRIFALSTPEHMAAFLFGTVVMVVPQFFRFITLNFDTFFQNIFKFFGRSFSASVRMVNLEWNIFLFQ